VLEAVDPHCRLIVLDVSVEAHALQIPMPHGLISGDNKFVLSEVIEDGLEKVHAGVLPKASMVVQYLVPQNVSHGCILVVRTIPVKFAESFEDLVGEGEVFLGNVL